MSKVKSEAIEAALVKLIDNINSTMPDTRYKFILGGAAGMLGISGLDQIKGVIASFADDSGLIDTEKIRTVYQSAFNASGGKL